MVQLKDFLFVPASLTVPRGTTVAFRNLDRAEHTVTEGRDGVLGGKARFDRDVDIDQSVDIAFVDADVVEITCRLHPTMNMRVTVAP